MLLEQRICSRVHGAIILENTVLEYFEHTSYDKSFYEDYLNSRLPASVVDAHVHLCLKEHTSNVPDEVKAEDWAVEAGPYMSYEDLISYKKELFPNQSFHYVGFPWPLYDADTEANNSYISKLISDNKILGLLTIRPEYDNEYIEQLYCEGGFSGFKPYPYMANTAKGADISIFDFIPHKQFELANKLKSPVLIHLPRANRLPDKDNIKELRVILNNYPNVKPVVAHYGRCFNIEHLETAIKELGSDIHRLWFDTAAVLNPAVHRLALEKLDYKKILFGTDLPIMLWHGKRRWERGTYINLCRENFTWNKHLDKENEESYTFFIYEQLKCMLDAIGENEEIKNAIFYDNAISVYGKGE